MRRIEFQYGFRVWILYVVGAGVGAYVDAYFLPTRAWLHAYTRTRVHAYVGANVGVKRLLVMLVVGGSSSP